MEAKKLLRKLKPDLIEELKNNEILRKYSTKQLNLENKKYGYFLDDISHPYYIINYIGKLIYNHIENEDIEVDVSGTEFTRLKDKIPLSQLMSIYLVPIIIYGK